MTLRNPGIIFEAHITSRYIFLTFIEALKINLIDFFVQYDTKYYYKVGSEKEGAREFFFTTPPAPGPDAAYTFGLIGKLNSQLSEPKHILQISKDYEESGSFLKASSDSSEVDSFLKV